MTLQQQPVAKTAVVIGGGMAGLLAARTLADYYAYVTFSSAIPCLLSTSHVKVCPRDGTPMPYSHEASKFWEEQKSSRPIWSLMLVDVERVEVGMGYTYSRNAGVGYVS